MGMYACLSILDHFSGYIFILLLLTLYNLFTFDLIK